ncbi:MAG: hypothetical protein JEZ07_17215 [Phycisphaerae bacterium]|nr:hypothetical protein [Phycisphaerae bacterium]
MSKDILYLGDTLLDQAASYLAGVMTHFDISFDYIASEQKFDDALFDKDYKAIILSDYPAANFTKEQLATLASKVNKGLGLLMIGGWESYYGLGGNWHETILTDVLPVEILKQDDRRNNWNPCVVGKVCDHAIIEGLPLNADMPIVGGFNEFVAKADSTTILNVQCYQADPQGEAMNFILRKVYPLMVVGNYGSGNVASFASDVAPHWVGGLVDWGKDRITSCATGAVEIEVGGYYAKMFANLVEWTANKLKTNS